MFMGPEVFLRIRHGGPRTAGEWLAFIIAVAVSVGADTFLKKNFPDMNRRMRRAFSSIPMLVILFVYFFYIKSY